MTKRKIIVLSAIRNENWIIDSFLKSVSIFADAVIILDQSLNNNEKEYTAKYPKLIYKRNDTNGLDESYRQNLLIKAAREISNDAILIALDADEFLSQEFFENSFQQKLHQLQPGFGMKFKMLNIFYDFQKAWQVQMNPIIYADDGAPYDFNNKIHNYRLPFNKKRIIKDEEVKVYHFQFLDWKRMASKHRWYQVTEKIQDKNKSNIEIYRLYNHMNSIPKNKIIRIDKNIFKNYTHENIDLTLEIDFRSRPSYWWDEETLILLKNNNDINFFTLDIYDSFLTQIMKPKSQTTDRLLLSYLRRTQKLIYPGRFNIYRYIFRTLDKILGLLR